MPGFSLPTVGSNSDMKALANAFMMLVKELKFLLQNLDNDNISELDASKIKNLDLDTLFSDLIVANTIITNSLYADYIQSNTAVTNILYAQEGRIARLTVDHLLTGDFLAGSPKIYFIEAKDQYLKFIEGTRTDTQVQYTTEPEDGEETGDPLYWDSAEHNYMTPTETDFPVMVYVYDLLVKREINFEIDPESGFMVPKDIHGAGVGNEDHPEWGKGYDYKGVTEFIRKYYSSTGKEKTISLGDDGIEIKNVTADNKESTITMGEFVDAKMRRIDAVNINKSLGEVTVLMEGETVPETIDYTEDATSMTFTWADGHTATVSIS